jgi:dephospho-CoA kinase
MPDQDRQTKPEPAVIAVVGLCGTGKSEVVRILESRVPFATVYFGGVVLDEIRKRGLDVTEKNEAAIRTELRASLGMAAMAVMRMPEIEEALAARRNVLIDGLYSYAEHRLLQDSLASAPVLIAVHARKDLRAARLAARAVRPLTLAEMEARDRHEIEKMEKGGPIALADHHIVNDGPLEELTAAVHRCADRIGLPAATAA